MDFGLPGVHFDVAILIKIDFDRNCKTDFPAFWRLAAVVTAATDAKLPMNGIQISRRWPQL
jgi:hypothetical protein